MRFKHSVVLTNKKNKQPNRARLAETAKRAFATLHLASAAGGIRTATAGYGRVICLRQIE